MAIVHREPNQVKWIGVRPGHNGEQIIANNDVNNATVIVYTVPANKILLLNGFNCNCWASAASTGSIEWWDAVPILYRRIAKFSSQINSVYFGGNDYTMPLELAAGHSIRIISAAAAYWLYATIWGILIDA